MQCAYFLRLLVGIHFFIKGFPFFQVVDLAEGIADLIVVFLHPVSTGILDAVNRVFVGGVINQVVHLMGVPQAPGRQRRLREPGGA